MPASAAPAGAATDGLDPLLAWLIGGGVLVWLLTMALGVYAAKAEPAGAVAGRRLIAIAGGAIPVAVVVGLLWFGLRPYPFVAPAEADHVIYVTGHMWWWRVRYDDGSPAGIASANVLHLPRGRTVELRLESDDVIHSLWIPALERKLDLIPGTTNRLILRAPAAGHFAGACAEYCGIAHANMRFDVVVVPPDEFERRLREMTAPALPPANDAARDGFRLFRDLGCGACHTVRGTGADGDVGPDLTHVASRPSLGAGLLPTGQASFVEWVVATESVKPGVHMPQYAMLSPADRAALGAYLAGLE